MHQVKDLPGTLKTLAPALPKATDFFIKPVATPETSATQELQVKLVMSALSATIEAIFLNKLINTGYLIERLTGI